MSDTGGVSWHSGWLVMFVRLSLCILCPFHPFLSPFNPFAFVFIFLLPPPPLLRHTMLYMLVFLDIILFSHMEQHSPMLVPVCLFFSLCRLLALGLGSLAWCHLLLCSVVYFRLSALHKNKTSQYEKERKRREKREGKRREPEIHTQAQMHARKQQFHSRCGRDNCSVPLAPSSFAKNRGEKDIRQCANVELQRRNNGWKPHRTWSSQ